MRGDLLRELTVGKRGVDTLTYHPNGFVVAELRIKGVAETLLVPVTNVAWMTPVL